MKAMNQEEQAQSLLDVIRTEEPGKITRPKKPREKPFHKSEGENVAPETKKMSVDTKNLQKQKKGMMERQYHLRYWPC